jgi:hypothetical protein
MENDRIISLCLEKTDRCRAQDISKLLVPAANARAAVVTPKYPRRVGR